jgi:iron complex transport system substrate-binding protein
MVRHAQASATLALVLAVAGWAAAATSGGGAVDLAGPRAGGRAAAVPAAAAAEAGGEVVGAGTAGTSPAAGAAPARVVSLNLCTDQIAMLIAAPGQLVAVSHLAADPRLSAMAAEARAHRLTRGQAEEVFLMRPDLVLAGTYTTRATVDLLRRLGIRVETFPPVDGLDAIGPQIRAIGAAMGRAAEAEALAARIEADLAALAAGPPAGGARPRAALYAANGWTGGADSLSGAILAAAGYANAAAEAGLEGGGFLPLELLIRLAPDLVIPSERYPGASRAEELLSHPALARLPVAPLATDADWVCGTPAVLRALARLIAVRAALGAAPAGAGARPAPAAEAAWSPA